MLFRPVLLHRFIALEPVMIWRPRKICSKAILHLNSQFLDMRYFKSFFNSNSVSMADKIMNVISTQKNILKHIALSANKIVQSCFVNVAFENRSIKAAMISCFCWAHCLKSSISNKSVKNCLSKLLIELISKNLSKQIFEITLSKE